MTPFHRIQQWNAEEKYFSPAWLVDLGIKIFLGHSGLSCEEAGEGTDFEEEDEVLLTDDEGIHVAAEEEKLAQQEKPSRGNRIWVVDITGVHPMEVIYCNCRGQAQDLQFIDLQLWPASFQRIKTVFTFQVLEDFRLDNLEARTSAYHYFSRLRRITDPIFPQNVPDRYRELMRVARQWRNIALHKVQGFGHRDSQDNPPPGGLALFCAACPQPGVNLPSGWENEKDRFVYIRQLALDGNFVASHIAKAGRTDTVWLMDGQAYMTNHVTFKDHLIGKPAEDTRSTCHNHRAQLDKNLRQSGRDVTGVGATACARHGCFCPSSVVDFQKGERQVNMDYSVSEALRMTNSIGLLKAITFYGINCQYFPNMQIRWTSKPDLFWPEDMEMQPAIGLLHVHGHQESCMAEYSPSYIPGAGRTDGEIVETLWSKLNDVTRSAQTASLPHRAETMDDHMWDSNWKKILGLVVRLCKKYEDAKTNLPDAETYFFEITLALSSTAVSEWTTKIEAAEREQMVNLSIMRAQYLPDIGDRPGMLQKSNELLAKTTQKKSREIIHWVSEAIQLEEDQIRLRALIRRGYRKGSSTHAMPKTLEISLERQAHALSDQIEKHYEKAEAATDAPTVERAIHANDLGDEHSSEDEDGEPQPTKLRNYWEKSFSAASLPLVLPSLYLTSSPLVQLSEEAKIECNLRRARLDETLRGIRTAINHKYYWLQSKFRTSIKKDKERFDNMAKEMQDSINDLRRVYSISRSALQKLDPANTWGFLPLTKEDVRIPSWMKDLNTQGSRNAQVSWIWHEYQPPNQGPAGTGSPVPRAVGEFDRLTWLKARAQRNRWKEEFELLRCEMDWTIRYFQYQYQQWEIRLKWAEEKNKPGHAIYARMQMAIWRDLGVHGEAKFKVATDNNFVSIFV